MANMNPHARTLDGVNTASPAEVEQAQTLAEVMGEMRDHLRLLTMPRAPRRLVDITESVASATTLTLRPVVSALALLDTIVYSIPAAATLTIGTRSIALPGPAVGSLRVGQMTLYPYDTITLALSGGSPTPGALFLEVMGWQIPPSEHFEVVR